MATTTSNSPLRKQASAAIDAAAADIQNEARQELDSLRNAVNARLAALERALSREENDSAFEAIVEKLCEVAAEQTDAACTWTRAQLEDAAAKELATVRARAKAELDRAKADLDRARADLDAATALMDETRADFEERLAKADAAAVDTARTLAEFKAQTEVALREGEQRFAQSEKARLEAARALAESERVAAAARQEADAGAASLAEARTQIASLEGVRSDLMLAREIAETHLEGEAHHRNVIVAELEAARAKALQAKADADAIRLQLQRATARIGVLEAGHRSGVDESVTTTGDPAAAIGRVRSALQRLSGAATGRAMLDAALESLAENFSRAALCVVTPQGCTVWGSRGFDPPLESRRAVIPLTEDALLRRGLDEWKPATMQDTDGDGLVGLSGHPIAYAIALPIMPQDKGAVMLYAENPPEWSREDASVAEAISGIIIDHLGQRLRPRKTGAAAEPPPYLRVRQARRVKIQAGGDVAVDGAHSTLVDLSTHGAQVLSPRAIRPNCSVRLQLPSNSGGLSCEARVVWVLVEQGQDTQNALYRAGVQFTDVDMPELEAFFAQHGLAEPSIRH
jgi:chemotaxis protein histidine kinase CheA